MLRFPRRPAPSWPARYVGTPYRERGRDFDGFDCWGLVVHGYRDEFGVDVPDHGPDFPEGQSDAAFVMTAQRLIRQQRKLWTPLTRAVPGATVLIRRGGHPVHTGLVTPGGDLLHADADIGQVLRERLSDLSVLVTGIYAPPGVGVPDALRGEAA